jgi:hypothetical protein
VADRKFKRLFAPPSRERALSIPPAPPAGRHTSPRAARTLRSTLEQGRGRCSTPTAGPDTRRRTGYGRPARASGSGQAGRGAGNSTGNSRGSERLPHAWEGQELARFGQGTPQGPAGSTLRQQRRTPGQRANLFCQRGDHRPGFRDTVTLRLRVLAQQRSQPLLPALAKHAHQPQARRPLGMVHPRAVPLPPARFVLFKPCSSHARRPYHPASLASGARSVRSSQEALSPRFPGGQHRADHLGTEYRKIKRPFPPTVCVHPIAYPAPPEALPAVFPSARPARPPGRSPAARRPLSAPQAPGRAEKTRPNVWGWLLQWASNVWDGAETGPNDGTASLSEREPRANACERAGRGPGKGGFAALASSSSWRACGRPARPRLPRGCSRAWRWYPVVRGGRQGGCAQSVAKAV